jgi:hypothetical protein
MEDRKKNYISLLESSRKNAKAKMKLFYIPSSIHLGLFNRGEGMKWLEMLLLLNRQKSRILIPLNYSFCRKEKPF